MGVDDFMVEMALFEENKISSFEILESQNLHTSNYFCVASRLCLSSCKLHFEMVWLRINENPNYEMNNIVEHNSNTDQFNIKQHE